MTRVKRPTPPTSVAPSPLKPRPARTSAIADRQQRLVLGRRIAEVTHTHPLAVEGALYVAGLASARARAAKEASRSDLVRHAAEVLSEPALRGAVEAALTATADPVAAAQLLGSTGFVLHSVGLTTWAFVHGSGHLDSIQLAIRAGGDTDTHAAIVGGWVGALLGDSALPAPLVEHLAAGPFGARHLTGLAETLRVDAPLPRSSSVLTAFGRNLALYPVVLAHGFRRLIPFG